MWQLLHRMLKGRSCLYPYERRFLEELASRMEVDAGAQLRRQIASINKTQRLSKGKEVNLYKMTRGKASFDENLRFPHEKGEVLLATVELDTDRGKPLTVDVWMVNGRLFSLAYDKPPKEYFAAQDLENVETSSMEVKVHLDPMSQGTPTRSTSVDAASLTGWLHEWQMKGLIVGLHPPMASAERSECLQRMDTTLPSDYIELMQQTDGLELESVVVHGLARTRQLVLPEANYWVLAESSKYRAVAIEEGSHSSTLFVFNYVDDERRSAGNSFQQALQELLAS